jgi:RNA polymerase sigma-70 factor, ECF subfamily
LSRTCLLFCDKYFQEEEKALASLDALCRAGLTWGKIEREDAPELRWRPVSGSAWPGRVVLAVRMDTSRKIESALVERLNRRDATALPELYDICGDRLYAFVFNLVDRNHGIAEDIVQDVWLSAVRGLDRYQGRSQPYTWLCGIALHKIQDFWRRKGREFNTRYDPPGDDEQPEALQLMDTGPLPEEIAESEDTRRAVRRALGSLPEHYRTVLVLKYLEQMSTKEIAQVIDKTPKAVESSIDRAKIALRDRILGTDRQA